MSYGVKYTCTHKTFTNQTETTYRIDILKNGYSGSSTEVLGTGDIFNLEYEKIDATKPLSTPLQNSRLEFNLLVRDASDQAILTEIFDNDERTFKMQLYQNGSLFWDGYVLNDLLEYGQGDYPQEGRIVAKDITALKSFTYPLEDERRTVIHQIGVLLDPLNIGTALKTVTSWTHDEMSSTNTFLAQTYLDTIAFREFRPLTDTGANNDGQITYYEALEQLARSFGLVIRQSFGEWHIVQISELRGSTSRVCTFDFAGSQNTNAVQDITDSIDSDTTYILPQSQNTFNPGLKEARYTFNHRTLERDIVFPNAVRFSEEDDGDTARTFSQQIVTEAVDLTPEGLRSRGGVTPKIRFKSDVGVLLFRELDGTSQENTANIALLNIAQRADATVTIKVETVSKTYFLNSQGDWVTDSAGVNLSMFSEGSPIFGTGGNSGGGRSTGTIGYVSRSYKGSFDIESEPLPKDADGELKIELRLANILVPNTNVSGFAVPGFTPILSSSTVYSGIELNIDKPSESANSESISFNILNDGSNLSAVYEHGSVIFGDGPESFSPSALRYSTQEADFTSGGWDSPGGSGTYSQTLLREILFIQASARRNLSAELYGEYKPNRVLSFESLRFFFLGGSLNGNNVWSADFLEISYESPSASFDELAEGGGSTFSGASSGDLQTFREAVKANQFFNTIFLSNFIGELSSPISAGSTITSFTANLSAQIRVGEDFVLVDKANERPFFVSVVADPNTGAEEYNTGENRVVHVEEQFIKNDLPVGSPVILSGGLLESYFTIDPTKLSISVDSMTDATALGRVDHSSREAGDTFDFIKLSNNLVSADNPVQVKDDEQLVLRSRGGQVQTLVARGDQTYTSSPFQLQVDSFTHAFDVGTASYTTGGVVEVLNVGSSVARIDIKADENEASITSLTSITTNNGLTASTNITQRVTTAESEINSATSILTTNGLSGSTNITQRTSIVEGEVDGIQSTVVLKADAQGNISRVELNADPDGTNISITADDVNINNINFNSAGGTISSSNYSSGSAGWEIDGNGDAEFNSITLRNPLSSGNTRIFNDTIGTESTNAGGSGSNIAYAHNPLSGNALQAIRSNNFLFTHSDHETLDGSNNEVGTQLFFGFYSGGATPTTSIEASGDGNFTFDVDGDIECTTLTETSDKYQKENIEPLGSTLDRVIQLEGKTFDMIGPSTEKKMGLLAQDVEPLFPEAVGVGHGENEEGERIEYKTLSYTQLIPALIESIKELKQEIDQLKNEQGI